MIKERIFVSFDEPCAFQCKHCYTYQIKRKKTRNVDEIVDSISGKKFDIIYVSQKTDNFSDPERGFDLCEKLIDRYNTNLFIITRNVIDDVGIQRLINIRDKLNRIGKRLFIAISINALTSYYTSENPIYVPSPEKRIDFIIRLADQNLSPILMLRPVFPNSLIPVEECISLVEKCADYISCVVSSGLGVNEDVLSRLGLKKENIRYSENQEYLQGAIESEIKFVEVKEELERIEKKCNDIGCPFFKHSMPALNYLINVIDSNIA